MHYLHSLDKDLMLWQLRVSKIFLRELMYSFSSYPTIFFTGEMNACKFLDELLHSCAHDPKID